MKLIFTSLAVALSCFAFGCSDHRYGTTVTVTDDGKEYQLQAKFPARNTAIINEKLDHWAAQAIARSGQLSDTLRLQFPDSSNCRVHASGRDLLITAAKNSNTKAQLEHLKLDYKAIRDLIVAHAKTTKKK